MSIPVLMKIVLTTLFGVLLPVLVSAAVSVAVFPLQELGKGRQGVNLQLTNALAERLAGSGLTTVFPDEVISFMAANRIRNLGTLERYHVAQVRRDLGATFLLLGTVSERNKRSKPAIGLTLNLVRTSDARTVWTYAGSFSVGRQRKILEIGEAQTSDQLQPLLLDEVFDQWPSLHDLFGLESVQDAQFESLLESVSIDALDIEPTYPRPGVDMRCWVRLRNDWSAGHAPQISIKVADQLYPAVAIVGENTFEATWVASEQDGRYPVNLSIVWPETGRTETFLLGSYFVDGTAPSFRLDLRGNGQINGVAVFDEKLKIFPVMIAREQLSRWRLLIYSEQEGEIIDELDGEGKPPESLLWNTKAGGMLDGRYDITVELWDLAGNSAQVSTESFLNTQRARLVMDLNRKGEKLLVNLKNVTKVPLRYWWLEMWNKEGRMITRTEGKELPVTLKFDLPDSDDSENIDGFVLYSDVMGGQQRRRIKHLLPKTGTKIDKKAAEEKSNGISEGWVEEF